MSSPRKIAVIGGGVGAVTATYAITQLPDWQSRYDITLYQRGWRLGGKGASGRNAAHGQRIEEHGLHIWAGFYDNAFRLMRDCYDVMNATGLRQPDAPLGTLDAAFKGLNYFMLAEDIPQPDGTTQLHPWRIDFEPNDNIPGTGSVLPTPFAYFQMLAAAIAHIVETHLPATPHTLPEAFHPGTRHKALPLTAPSPFHHLHAYARSLTPDAFTHKTTESLHLSALARHAQDWHHAQTAAQSSPPGDNARRMAYLVSLSSAFFRGALESGLFRSGFDAIDTSEISAWLLHYGASHDAVYSAVFQGCYDYVFGYPGGVTDHRSVGAGTAIRGLLRLAFTYKGALFYKMQAGMGDTIFAPYYQVLAARGVKFRFFNAAANLHLTPDRTGISAIDMVEQAAPKTAYAPLVDVQRLPCWPAEPLWDQLEGGAALAASGIDFECEKDPDTGRAYQLQHGRDFDDVILGASIGSLPRMTAALAAASPRWQAMLDHVPTVATHAAQFWLTRTPEALGWNALVAAHNDGPQTNLKTVITSFAEPLDTWADMSDLLPREDWPAKGGPVSLAYFCSPCGDAGTSPAPFQTTVTDWANSQLTRLWPRALKTDALKNGTFDASLLYAPGAATPDARFAAQYYRENLYGSERYVLSVPNSVQYRLPPDDSGFANLFLAGDWTRCGINAGCVEAATISGLIAARGLTGAAIHVVGEGDLGPESAPQTATLRASPYAQAAPWPLTPVFGRGQIDGWFSFHAVDAAAIQSILPKGMSLHPQHLTPPGTHPVAILANRQVGVGLSLLPRLLDFSDYFEGIIAINHVQIAGHPGVFSYLPNLYLTNLGAQLSGVAMYGMNKRMGQLSMDDASYRVASTTGTPIWSGRYQQQGFAQPLAASPECARVQSLTEQTLVMVGKLTPWQFAAFDFNLSSAHVAGVAAEITIADQSLADLPAGPMTARPLAQSGAPLPQSTGLPGAFRIWTSWTLSNPLDSPRIARLEAENRALP